MRVLLPVVHDAQPLGIVGGRMWKGRSAPVVADEFDNLNFLGWQAAMALAMFNRFDQAHGKCERIGFAQLKDVQRVRRIGVQFHVASFRVGGA